MRRLLELLFPAKCVLCGTVLEQQETDLCRHCRENAPEYVHRRQKPRFASEFTAVWYYEEYVRQSLLRYKFYNRRSYAPAYGRALAMKISRELSGGYDCVTWVPVSRRRRRERGYDQVELLARAVAGELELPCEGLLEKIRNNRPNSSLATEQERRANVLGAYRLRQDITIENKRVLLLDDILTTGATASECARVLLTAGAKEVACAAVAAGRKQK